MLFSIFDPTGKDTWFFGRVVDCLTVSFLDFMSISSLAGGAANHPAVLQDDTPAAAASHEAQQVMQGMQGEQGEAEHKDVKPPQQQLGHAEFPVGLCSQPFCQSTFASWEEHVRHHREVHHPGEEAARVCERCAHFSLTKKLADHHRVLHVENNRYVLRYQCPGCIAQFINEAKFKKHLQQFHGHRLRNIFR